MHGSGDEMSSFKRLGGTWGTKHCRSCNKQTKHDVLKLEELDQYGYPNKREIAHSCVVCSETNVVLRWVPIPTDKFDILHNLTEPQLEYMAQAQYNGENFRNYIELRDKISNEQKKLMGIK